MASNGGASQSSSAVIDGTDEEALAVLAEEPALLRVDFGDALVGEAAGELFFSWVSTLSLTDVVARFCRLSVSTCLGLTARRGSLGDLEAAEVWGDDL